MQGKETFAPVLIRENEDSYLEEKVESPPLLLELIAYDQIKQPVEFFKFIVPVELCKFYTELI